MCPVRAFLAAFTVSVACALLGVALSSAARKKTRRRGSSSRFTTDVATPAIADTIEIEIDAYGRQLFDKSTTSARQAPHPRDADALAGMATRRRSPFASSRTERARLARCAVSSPRCRTRARRSCARADQARDGQAKKVSDDVASTCKDFPLPRRRASRTRWTNRPRTSNRTRSAARRHRYAVKDKKELLRLRIPARENAPAAAFGLMAIPAAQRRRRRPRSRRIELRARFERRSGHLRRLGLLLFL